MTAIILWMIVRRADQSLSLEGKVAAKDNLPWTCPSSAAFGGYSTRSGMRRWRIPVSGALPKGKPI